jgi:hypothetical protein
VGRPSGSKNSTYNYRHPSWAFAPGQRTMLARTCVECGAFRPGDEFRTHGTDDNGKRTADPVCKACENNDRKRLNATTYDGATQHRSTWTPSEEQYLLDHPHATALELAAALGRTWKAIQEKRRILRRTLEQGDTPMPQPKPNYRPHVPTPPARPTPKPPEVCPKCFLVRPCEHDDGLA